MNDSYLYAIIALLPLAACMVVFQVNPYHALVIRGILGAVAAMVYAVLGAPDVALTEALVGTMLAITLYAVAVRSSLVMRLGLLEHEVIKTDEQQDFGQLMNELRKIFRKRQMHLELVPYPNTQALQRALIDKEVHGTCVRQQQADPDPKITQDKNQSYHTTIKVKRIYFRNRQMYLELFPYPNTQALQPALIDKEVHGTCVRQQQADPDPKITQDENQSYHTTIRVKRIYDIIQSELASPAIILSYVNTQDSTQEHK